ncbi:hypothetical protein PSN45_005096 [Yamadazyma tenuis]|uniref:Major facilitator superfamily (MFS) profile domain-containing protein n=1 Tax=Candida tenuis (strain ATCC 10573 / BCRC 21748 / CBS 615 / JCM 9827 / NBRC 10315 / NRRL Y-1498 / VKM Y-70) TaxID=590646 RepID=G3B2S8_CANTC|nr:uncharacterized protein CANTEDRAFT_120700 [Yamadazyma tenuis ATCC 10573]EGV64754.1 hypothetical protein CANTEDRAFT_120700 [Yamadazyma tenuis ATCC 10573]WEJ97542.1 hypothetical protein PSN45_005096 [Yamadazyma tenuis]
MSDLEENVPVIKKFVENDAGDGTRREDQYLTGRKLVIALLSVLSCMFLVGLDQTIVTTILTQVGNKFDAFSKIGWLVSGFMVPIAVFAANWGQASIIFGRKYTMLVGIVLFEAGSLLCALATGMNMLIGGRVLAGFGAGCIQTLVFIVSSEMTPINLRPFVFASFGLVMAVSLVSGPIIGGAFASSVSWRWCFYVNLPIGGLAGLMFSLTFNPPPPKIELRSKFKLIDYTGTLLIAAGVVLFLVGVTFTSTGQYPWDSAAVISMVVLGSLFFISFFVWSFKFSHHPLIPFDLVKVLPLTAAGFCMFFMFMTFMGSLLYQSVYYQNIKGRDALHSGLSTLTIVIPMIMGSVGGGIAIGRTRHIKPFLVSASAIVLVGSGLLTLVEVDSSLGQLIGYNIPFSMGCGLLLQGCLSSSQVVAPKIDGGIIMASSFMLFMRSIGAALASILCDIIYHSSFNTKLQPALNALTDKSLIDELSAFDFASLSSNTGSLATLSPKALLVVRKVMMNSIRNVYYFVCGTAALALIFGVFTSNRRVPSKDEVVTKKERDAQDRAALELANKSDNALEASDLSSRISTTERDSGSVTTTKELNTEKA